jgi:serine/threonine-protein kinase
VADDETAEEIARFRREAQAAGRLTHPNIVGVFDYGETADLAYIVMEYVDGPPLKNLLDKHERFPLPRIVQIMQDLLTGLQFSHERGVVHRDIKPANLMLTKSGQAKIADFGIARIESSSMTQAGTVLGTPAYMSPEQFMGQVVDARSDIYSSGVLLYQLLTGERPFEGSMSAIMHKALNTEAPMPSQISVTVPRPFDSVVRKAMAKRPTIVLPLPRSSWRRSGRQLRPRRWKLTWLRITATRRWSWLRDRRGRERNSRDRRRSRPRHLRHRLHRRLHRRRR